MSDPVTALVQRTGSAPADAMSDNSAIARTNRAVGFKSKLTVRFSFAGISLSTRKVWHCTFTKKLCEPAQTTISDRSVRKLGHMRSGPSRFIRYPRNDSTTGLDLKLFRRPTAE